VDLYLREIIRCLGDLRANQSVAESIATAQWGSS
jgi:hypothetical protein